MKNKDWFVYIIMNEKGFLYTGITTDIDRRFKEHAGTKKGAKFFRGGAPVELIYTKKCLNRSDASKFEAWIKSLTRLQKLKLVEEAA